MRLLALAAAVLATAIPAGGSPCTNYSAWLHSATRIEAAARSLDVSIEGSLLAVAAAENGLRLYDVSDPTNPDQLSALAIPGFSQAVVLFGGRAYVAAGSAGLHIIDVSDPATPDLLRTVDTPGLASDVTCANGVAYVADDEFGLAVVDVSDPLGASIVGTVDTPGFASGVAHSGNYVFVADFGTGMRIIDVSDPHQPESAGFVPTPATAEQIVIDGTDAYVAGGSAGVRRLDIADPTAPVDLGVIDTPGYCVDLVVIDDLLWFMDTTHGLGLVDLGSGASVILRFDTLGPPLAVAAVGDHLILAEGSSGVEVVDVDPPVAAPVGSLFTTGVRGQIEYRDGLLYVPVSQPLRLQVVDVSDPAAPWLRSEVHVAPDETPNALAIRDDLAWIVTHASLCAVDIRDPDNPIDLGEASIVPHLREVGLLGTWAYVCDSRLSAALHVVDISNPASPSLVTSAALPSGGRGRGLTVIPEAQLVYVALGEMGLAVFDVAVPAVPALLGVVDLPGFCSGMATTGSLLYVGAGPSGFHILDLQNPREPLLRATVNTPVSGVHPRPVPGLLYVTDERGGVEVFQATDPARPRLIGSIAPPAGAWGVYDLAVAPSQLWGLIRWSGGAGVQGFAPQCARRLSERPYDGDHPEPREGSRRLVTALGPNPFRDEISARVSVPGGELVSAGVYDVVGRLVRELRAGSGRTQEESIRWDGRDSRGIRAAPGVYFLDIRSGSFVDRRKIVLLR